MLLNEAKWIGDWLLAHTDAFPLCNIGSSTEEFRTRSQPWIDEHIFSPARALGGEVVHIDRKEARGVDIVCDVTKPDAAAIVGRQFRTVLCCNLLEHVEDISAVCATIWSLVAPGGYLVLTGPYRYPLHLDPIDNGFRGSPEECARMFQGAEMVAAEIVKDGTYARYMFRSPSVFIGELGEVFSVWRGRRWLTGMRRWGWLHRRYCATAVVLRRGAVERANTGSVVRSA